MQWDEETYALAERAAHAAVGSDVLVRFHHPILKYHPLVSVDSSRFLSQASLKRQSV